MKKNAKYVPVAALVMIALLSGYFANTWDSTASSALALNQAAAQGEDTSALTFEWLRQATLNGNLYRARIPGGWLVGLVPSNSQQSTSMVYIPDPTHQWDGKSLPRRR